MKITFEETLSRKEWLHSELMNSLTGEIIEKAMEDQFYDVKLVVNGIEIEPYLYNDIMNGIENYINQQAKSLIKEKLNEVDNKISQLNGIIDESKNKILDEMGLNLDI